MRNKRTSSISLTAVIAGLLLTASSASGQLIAVGDEAGSKSIDDYNFKFSNFYIDLAAVLRTRWESGSQSSEARGEETMTVEPGFIVRAFWPVSPYLTVQSGVQIRYRQFIFGDGAANQGLIISGVDDDVAASLNSEFLIDPNTRLFWENSLRSRIETISQVANTRDDGNNQPENFNRFDLESTLRYAQDFTPYTSGSLEGSFNRTFIIDEGDAALQRNRYRGTMRVTSTVREDTTITGRGSINYTDFDDERRADALRLSAGPDVRYIINPAMNVSLGTGLTTIYFLGGTDSSGGNTGLSYYVDGDFNYEMTNAISHQIFARRTITESDDSRLDNSGNVQFDTSVERINVGYKISWRAMEDLRLRAQYSHQFTNGSAPGIGYKAHRALFGTSYELNPDLTFGLDYRYQNEYDSETESTEFVRHSVNFRIQYNF